MGQMNFYYEGMAGAPASSLDNSSIIHILDACLVNGLSQVTLMALNRSGSVVTCTKTGHPFKHKQMVEIAGATPTVYNGKWRVDVIDADHFSFNIGSLTPGAATGTITAKTPSLGWSKVFSATNRAAYQAPDGNCRPYLYIDDGQDVYNAQVRGYRTMSDIDSGDGAFPSFAKKPVLRLSRSNPAYPQNGGWVLVGDSKRFWLFTSVYSQNAGSKYRQTFSFGEFLSFKNGDAFNGYIAGGLYGDADDNATPNYWPCCVLNQSDIAWSANTSQMAACRDASGNNDAPLLTLMARGLASGPVNGFDANASQCGFADDAPSMGNHLAFVDLLEWVPTSHSGGHDNQLRGRLPGYMQVINQYDFAANDKQVKNNVDIYGSLFVVAHDNQGSGKGGTVFPIGDWSDWF